MPPTTPDFWYEVGNAIRSTNVLPSDRSATSTFPFTFSTRTSTMNAQNTEQGGEQRIKPLTAKEQKRGGKIAAEMDEIGRRETVAKYGDLNEEDLFAVTVRETIADYNQLHNLASDDDSDDDDDDGDTIGKVREKTEVISERENPHKGISPTTNSAFTASFTPSHADILTPAPIGIPPSHHIHSPSDTTSSHTTEKTPNPDIFDKEQQMQIRQLQHEKDMQAGRFEHEKELLRMRYARPYNQLEVLTEISQKYKHEENMRRIELEQQQATKKMMLEHERDLRKVELEKEERDPSKLELSQLEHARKKVDLQREEMKSRLNLETVASMVNAASAKRASFEHKERIKRLEEWEAIREMKLTHERKFGRLHGKTVTKDEEERKDTIAEAALDIRQESAGEEERKPDESS